MEELAGSLVYAVTIGTCAGAPVFDEIPFGLECLRLLREVCRRTGVRLHAWCLMPDHACLLLEAPRRETLGAALTTWKTLSSQARRRGGDGTVWQRGFAERAIGTRAAAGLAARYIVEKPVRAGLVVSSRDYPLCGLLG